MIVNTWQLQEAKNKFSKVVDDATHQGPQVITRRGVQVAVVVSFDEFRTMKASQGKLSEFFQSSPLAEIDLDLVRDRSQIRENGLQ